MQLAAARPGRFDHSLGMTAYSTLISLSYFGHGSLAFEDANLYGQLSRILEVEGEGWQVLGASSNRHLGPFGSWSMNLALAFLGIIQLP
jgi:hypothetical protein